jgi:hypothetical protein
MRKVLPRAGEDRGSRTGELGEHLLARDAAEKPDPVDKPKVADATFEGLALRPVADQNQMGVRNLAERGECDR